MAAALVAPPEGGHYTRRRCSAFSPAAAVTLGATAMHAHPSHLRRVGLVPGGRQRCDAGDRGIAIVTAPPRAGPAGPLGRAAVPAPRWFEPRRSSPACRPASPTKAISRGSTTLPVLSWSEPASLHAMSVYPLQVPRARLSRIDNAVCPRKMSPWLAATLADGTCTCNHHLAADPEVAVGPVGVAGADVPEGPVSQLRVVPGRRTTPA
jgi:hypothetical protein